MSRRTGVTTEHVAAAVGVSRQTVSRVLNGNPEGSSALRVRGFKAALTISGLPEEAGRIVNCDFHFDTALAVITDMLSAPERPTAIIADNDEIAFAALHAASARGLAVPDDLSVISFEDTPGVGFAVPPLTAVRQPIAAMVARCCGLLIDAVGEGPAEGSHEVAYQLVERSSTGAPANREASSPASVEPRSRVARINGSREDQEWWTKIGSRQAVRRSEALERSTSSSAPSR